MNHSNVTRRTIRQPAEAIDHVVRRLTALLVIAGAVFALLATSAVEDAGSPSELAVGVGLLLFAIWATLITTFTSRRSSAA
jgi:hypothetical protein